MSRSILLILCSVLFWSEEVRSGIVENEVKRGAFPFMAILYYPDETVVDSTGVRFQHGAVLIKPEWLLSAAIDHSVLDGVPLGFPRKTLLARMGATTLDANYTFNEDEDEQEREIIQIVKPNIHNKEVWWFTDITLLQTLVPFKLSSAVAPTAINPKRDYDDKNCAILVYAKKIGNATEDKVLMQLGVELLPPSVDNCGTQFSETTMTCSVPGDDMKNAIFDSEFCQGNSGGPLMCEGEVIALQSYIENNCRQPYLYQLLASWETLITCGTEQRCNANSTCNVCVAVHKDILSNETAMTPVEVITAKHNDTEQSSLPINSTEANVSEESVSWSHVTVAPETTTEIETSYVPTTTESPSIDYTVSRVDTSAAEPEAERRVNYLDLLNEETSSSTTTAQTTSSNTTIPTTVETSPPTFPPNTSVWPKAVSDFPTMEDDITPKTRVESLMKPKLGNRRHSSDTSSGNIVVPNMLPLLILVRLI